MFKISNFTKHTQLNMENLKLQISKLKTDKNIPMDIYRLGWISEKRELMGGEGKEWKDV